MVRSTALFLAVLALAGAASGCSSDDNDPGTSPTTPATTVTETFSESVNPNGARVHPFAAQAPGTVTATLTTLEPNTTVLIGLGLGTWNGVSCAITISDEKATQGVTLIGTASAAGNLCVRVYDNGNLTQSASYLVTVTHF